MPFTTKLVLNGWSWVTDTLLTMLNKGHNWGKQKWHGLIPIYSQTCIKKSPLKQKKVTYKTGEKVTYKTGEKVAYKTGEKVVVTGQENMGMFDCKGYQIRKALIIIWVGFVSLMFLQNRIW